MSVPYTIQVGPTTLTRAGEVLLQIQAPNLEHPECSNPAMTLPEVWTGLVRVGLNAIHYGVGQPWYGYIAADFASSMATAVDIDVEDYDDARATAVATALGIAPTLVVSAAARVGAAFMRGIRARMVGPLE